VVWSINWTSLNNKEEGRSAEETQAETQIAS